MASSRQTSNAQIQIRSFELSLADDLGQLLATDPSASACWCMWFINSVKEHQAAGSEGKRQKFLTLARETIEPLGLLAYQDSEAVAWCAVGPRERFARAARTPTLKGQPVSPTDATWFVPCFFVRRDFRRTGITKALLDHACRLAAEHGATLVQGFPYSGDRPRSSGDRQVGTERVFASCGFSTVLRPSDQRVVMQLKLTQR